MQTYEQGYESYRKYAEMIGSPVMTFEKWMKWRDGIAEDEDAQHEAPLLGKTNVVRGGR